jgi:hypothetical protein
MSISSQAGAWNKDYIYYLIPKLRLYMFSVKQTNGCSKRPRLELVISVDAYHSLRMKLLEVAKHVLRFGMFRIEACFISTFLLWE